MKRLRFLPIILSAALTGAAVPTPAPAFSIDFSGSCATATKCTVVVTSDEVWKIFTWSFYDGRPQIRGKATTVSFPMFGVDSVQVSLVATRANFTTSTPIIRWIKYTRPPSGTDTLYIHDTIPGQFVHKLTASLGETFPALPAILVNTGPYCGNGITACAGGTVRNASTANIQTQLNAAALGDVITIPNGAQGFTTLSLPEKTVGASDTTKWITIRPLDMTNCPAEGVRITPTIAAAINMPKLFTPTSNAQNAVTTPARSHHYRFICIEFGVGGTYSYGPIAVDNATSTGGPLVDMPHHFVFDRIYVHGPATFSGVENLKRCMLVNGKHVAIINSWIDNCKGNDENQGIGVPWAAGPIKVVNNKIGGSGESVIIGGSDPPSAYGGTNDYHVCDVEIRRNHFYKDTTWAAQGITDDRTSLEMKNACRVLVEGNVFERARVGSWQGETISIKSVNQGGTCDSCGTRDVTVRLNLTRITGGGFSMFSNPDGANKVSLLRRVLVHDNLLYDIAAPGYAGGSYNVGFRVGGSPFDITIAHNTVMGVGLTTTSMTKAIEVGNLGPLDPTVTHLPGTTGIRRLVYRDNITDGGNNVILGNGGGVATAALNSFANGVAVDTTDNWKFRKNAIRQTAGTNPNSGLNLNSYVASVATFGFTDLVNKDFSLTAGSAYNKLNFAGSIGTTDGKSYGAEIARVLSQTAGVVVAP